MQARFVVHHGQRVAEARRDRIDEAAGARRKAPACAARATSNTVMLARVFAQRAHDIFGN
jgi:hypothetical protein